MKTKQEEALIQVWNKLDDMWAHHQDGSDFCPTPERFGKDFVAAVEYRRKWGSEAMAFDIVFNEIQHIIRAAISEEAKKEMR